MTDDYYVGFENGLQAAISYLRDWPREGQMAAYFGQARHFADAIAANKKTLIPSPPVIRNEP